MQSENINQFDIVNNHSKPFDFRAHNQRILSEMPRDFVDKLKFESYDLFGVTRFTVGVLLLQFLHLSFVYFSLVFFVVMFAPIVVFGKLLNSYAEYSQLMGANNLMILISLILIGFAWLVWPVFMNLGKVKESFALNEKGICLYSNYHMDVINWNELEPKVKVLGFKNSCLVCYTYKRSFAKQLADIKKSLHVENLEDSSIKLSKAEIQKAVLAAVRFKNGTKKGQRSPILKLHGVKNADAVLAVSNFYFHQ